MGVMLLLVSRQWSIDVDFSTNLFRTAVVAAAAASTTAAAAAQIRTEIRLQRMSIGRRRRR